MKKRTIALLLFISIVMGLCGCSALYRKEYLSVSQYTEGEYDDYVGYFCDVADFAELKAAIIRMVSEHTEEGRIRFFNYSGNPQSDLAQACWEVKTETALASYAVDYMSSDPKPILNYYEAVVYIAYKHSEKEIAEIKNVSDMSGLVQGLEQVLGELTNYAVFHLANVNMTENTVLSAISKAYWENPVSCVVIPTAKVQVHPKSGIFRIVEIELYYGRTDQVLSEMRQRLSQRLYELTEKLQKDDKEVFALDAYNLLASNCSYDPEGKLRREEELEADLGATGYGALVEGYADSQGFAAAFSALCGTADIPCLVVEGTVDKASHFWNIIELDGIYYHVDVSADSTWGLGNSFLVSDEHMQSRYWWNIEEYPECHLAEG